MKKVVIFVLLAVAQKAVRSQGNPADIPSLWARLAESRSDTQRISLCTQLAASYIVPGRCPFRMDSTMAYLREARRLNAHIKSPYHRNQINIISALGRCLAFSSEDPRESFLPIIDSCKTSGDKRSEGQAWLYLGLAIGEDPSTNSYKLSCYRNGLAPARECSDSFTQLRLQLGIAHMQILMNHFDEAERQLLFLLPEARKAGAREAMYVDDELTYLYITRGEMNKALQYALNTQAAMGSSADSTSADLFFHHMFQIYAALGKHKERSEWGKRDLEFKSGTKDLPGVYTEIVDLTFLMRVEGNPHAVLGFLRRKIAQRPPTGLNDQKQVQQALGDAYLYDKQYDLAEKCYVEMIRLGNQMTHNISLPDRAFDHYKMGRFYFDRGLYEKARPFLEQSLKEYDEWGVLTYKRYGQELLFKTDSALGNYVEAIRHLRDFQRTGDSIFRADRNRQVEELQVAYQSEQKDKSIRLLLGKEQLAQLQLQNVRNTRNWTIAASVLLLIIAGLLYRQSRIRKKNNRLVTGKNIQLQQLVTEKDWLVKEIHHRVKNNLQTVTALLGTQSMYLKNEEAITAIDDSRRRIQSMSLIHQRLYQSNSLSAIHLPDYIHELVDFLKEGFDANKNVFFHLSIEPIDMDIQHCIPLGLILNEAITNSFKYAFPGGHTGAIVIELKHGIENNFLLTIRDDGVGFPRHFDLHRADSMGMTLMQGLAVQLGGHFAINGDNGTRIDVDFVYNPRSLSESAEAGIPNAISFRE